MSENLQLLILLWGTGLFMSILFLVMGLLLLYKPPKKINWFYGYRSKRSMIDQSSWDFANKISGKLFILTGIVSTIIFVVGFVIGYFTKQYEFGMTSLIPIITLVIIAMISFIIQILVIEKKLELVQKSI